MLGVRCLSTLNRRQDSSATVSKGCTGMPAHAPLKQRHRPMIQDLNHGAMRMSLYGEVRGIALALAHFCLFAFGLQEGCDLLQLRVELLTKGADERRTQELIDGHLELAT